jgi:hypothetical protein
LNHGETTTPFNSRGSMQPSGPVGNIGQTDEERQEARLGERAERATQGGY